ncbi:MAG: hypothetical protein WD397_11485 [Wenzhouxiangellaceae bacterium]
MDLIRWTTPISDYKSLYFKRLVDDGEGRFILESDSDDVFEILIGGHCGPYVMSNEEFLTKYWSIKPSGIGWTFVVDSSDLIRLFPGVMEPDDYKHYVVSTLDTCLEILSMKEPVIRKLAT